MSAPALTFSIFTISSEMPIHMGFHLFLTLRHSDTTRSASLRQLRVRQRSRTKAVSWVREHGLAINIHIHIGDGKLDIHVDDHVLVSFQSGLWLRSASLR